MHDSQQLIPLVEKLKNTLSTPSVVVADAGYKTPLIAKYLWSQGIRSGTSLYSTKRKRRIIFETCVSL
uniref:transposase n=1 Tax=Listeria welshimeri TaxID=1643 RepID=UPI002B2568F7|nr:transposase [Listeria welshimeri]